jgi:muconate cycloisomerase
MSRLDDERIIGLRIWHLQLPVVSARDHGIGRVDQVIDIGLLECETSGGIRGYGEASPWVVFTGSVEASLAAMTRYLPPLVLGRSLSDRQAICKDAEHAVAHATEAKAALETALLDASGKALGVSVAEMLGGAVRHRIPLSCSLANPDFDADLALVERLQADQVNIVKLKTGFADHRFDMMRLESLRKHFPDLQIRVDYNQGLSPYGAETKLRDVAGFLPDFIEQPVPARHFDAMRRLRESITVPLLADESVFSLADMHRAVAEDICDGVSIKIMKSGGLSYAQHIAALAEAKGLAAYGGDMFEAGVAHLAGTHMIAATPNITLGCEFYQAKYYLKEDILASPYPIVDGYAMLPEGAGLGIDPDLDKVNHYAKQSWNQSWQTEHKS